MTKKPKNVTAVPTQPDHGGQRPDDQAGGNRAARRAARKGKDAGDVPRGGFVTEGAQAAHSRSSTLTGPTAKHISAARSATGRRTQAKRDAR